MHQAYPASRILAWGTSKAKPHTALPSMLPGLARKGETRCRCKSKPQNAGSWPPPYSSVLRWGHATLEEELNRSKPVRSLAAQKRATPVRFPALATATRLMNDAADCSWHARRRRSQSEIIG